MMYKRNKCICTHKEHVYSISSSLFIRLVRDAHPTSDKCLCAEPSVWHQSREKRERKRTEEGAGGRDVHGQLALYSWVLTSREIGPEYQTQIPPPASSSRVIPTSPSQPSSSPQRRFPRQHCRRSEVRCGVGWGGCVCVSERGSIWMSDTTQSDINPTLQVG